MAAHHTPAPVHHTTIHGTHAPTHHGATHAPTHHGATHAGGGHGTVTHAGTHTGGAHPAGSHSGGHGVQAYELAILFITFGLFIGVLARWMITKFRINLPYTVVLLLLGILMAAIPTLHLGTLGSAIDSVRNINPHLLLAALIPALIFESAFATNFHIVAKEFAQCLMLAGPGVLINTALTGAFCVQVFPYGWTWSQALLFGAIVSATDPVAVVALLRDLGASKRLATLIEGESLLNDGTAFVAYIILLAFVSGDQPTAGQVVEQFMLLTFGGVITGIVFGMLVQFWLRNTFNDDQVEITITIISCYLCFHVAENEIGGSGVLACVFLGLVCSKYKSAVSPAIEQSMEHVWESLSYVANTIIFLLAGIIIMVGVNNDHGTIVGADIGWLIVIYVGIHLTRAVTIVVLWPLMFKCGYGLTIPDGIIMWYGALRGAIGLALALLTQSNTLGEAVESFEMRKYKDLVLFHTCGIVLLTLLVNATTIKYIVQYFHMDRPDEKHAELLIDTMKHLRARTEVEIRAMKNDPHYQGSDWMQVIQSLPNYGRIIRPDMKLGNQAPSCFDRCCGDSKGSKYKRQGFAEDATVQLLAPGALELGDVISNHSHHESQASDYDEKRSHASDVEHHHPPKSPQHALMSPAGRRATALSIVMIRQMEAGKRFGLGDDEDFDLNEYVSAKRAHHDEDQFSTTDGGMYDLDTLNQRILSVMKHSYWSSYEQGLISRSSVVLLMEAVESGLDDNDMDAHLKIIREAFDIPGYIRQWFEADSCHKQARRVLTTYILRAMEVGDQFEWAVHQVKHLLTEVRDLRESEQVKIALTMLDTQSYEITERTHELEILYPEVARVIQTRQAAQHIIHLERNMTDHMREEGLIDEGEYLKMLKLQLEAETDLYDAPFTAVAAAADDDALLNLPFMSEPGLPANLKQMVMTQSEERIIDRGGKVYQAGERAKGAIVISRGRAELRYAGRVIDTFTSGTMLAYDFFAQRPRLGDCVAVTAVKMYHIDGAILERLMEHPDVEAAVWRQSASMLIRSYFMEQLGMRTSIEVGRMCTVAAFQPIPNGDRVDIPSKTLLMTGVALHPISDKPILAPSVLNPIGAPYVFDQAAKVLVFDTEIFENELEFRPRGQSRGVQIHHF